MPDLPELVQIVIGRGIKRPIEILLGQQFHPAALILIYSGMDTMAFLSMPAAKADVMRSDFIAWVAQYIRLPGFEHSVGPDLYGARCSVLHGGAQSRFTREGRGRVVLYSGSSPLVVTPEELAKAFFEGVDRCLLDIANDAGKAEIAGRRLRELLNGLPYR
jgi:hypothetical protein